MSGEIFPTVFALVPLRNAVQRSRGWFRQIVRDTGCRYETLRRMANNLAYEPRLSEAERISAWFMRHGVPSRHPLTVRAQEARRQAADDTEAAA